MLKHGTRLVLGVETVSRMASFFDSGWGTPSLMAGGGRLEGEGNNDRARRVVPAGIRNKKEGSQVPGVGRRNRPPRGAKAHLQIPGNLRTKNTRR